jgi:hypothetical protein
MADQCLQLSQDQLNALINSGWILLGGPFPDQNTCLSNCGISSSSSSSSVSSGFSSSSFSSVGGCNCQPSGMAATWRFSLSGITNGTCADCANLNTTFTLSYTGGCLWQSNSITLCNTLFTLWGMSCVGNTWQLSIPGNGAVAHYGLPNASFNPFGPNTFTLVTTGANCTGWPATITITPV